MGDVDLDWVDDLARTVRDYEAASSALLAFRRRHREWVRRTGWRAMIWTTKDRQHIPVGLMEPRHAHNAAAMLRRNALSRSIAIAAQMDALYWDKDWWSGCAPAESEEEALIELRADPVYRALVLRATLHLHVIKEANRAHQG